MLWGGFVQLQTHHSLIPFDRWLQPAAVVGGCKLTSSATFVNLKSFLLF